MNYKNKDIHANINELGVDIGYIGANFYSKDVGTASIRINIFGMVNLLTYQMQTISHN